MTEKNKLVIPEPMAHVNQNGVIHEAGYAWGCGNNLSGLFTEQQLHDAMLAVVPATLASALQALRSIAEYPATDLMMNMDAANMRRIAEQALSATPEARAEPTESVLIDGTAYEVHADVAEELLRLHIELRQAEAPAAAPDARPAVLDSRWRERMLDGRSIVRDEMGFGDHPELPILDEGMRPREFFAALGIELKHTMAEDDLELEEHEAMNDAGNWSAWPPQPPAGEGWNLAAIFDTEDGQAAWWMRKIDAAIAPHAQADARDAELVKVKQAYTELASMFHDQIVAQQAAWIEWQHGKGAEEGMGWIENGLCGPGHIPDEEEPYGKEAQAWFDANKSDPLPTCPCGRPSNILWMGHGFCSNEHYDAHRAAIAAQATAKGV